MTADIDAVLSRLRERPECRDAVEVIERLVAELADARTALAVHSGRRMGTPSDGPAIKRALSKLDEEEDDDV